MNKNLNKKLIKEFLYKSSIWRINVIQEKGRKFWFEVEEKGKDDIRFIGVDVYKTPREAINDIKEMAI